MHPRGSSLSDPLLGRPKHRANRSGHRVGKQSKATRWRRCSALQPIRQHLERLILAGGMLHGERSRGAFDLRRCRLPPQAALASRNHDLAPQLLCAQVLLESRITHGVDSICGEDVVCALTKGDVLGVLTEGRMHNLRGKGERRTWTKPPPPSLGASSGALLSHLQLASAQASHDLIWTQRSETESRLATS